MSQCDDCGREYGADLNIPDWAWKKISLNSDDNGHLCPTCICERLEKAGIKTVGRFVSGALKEAAGQTLGYVGDRVRLLCPDEFKVCFTDPTAILTIEKIERGKTGPDFLLAEPGGDPVEYFRSNEFEVLPAST